MNIALKGGLPYGRQVLLWGNRSSGKSTTALEMIGIAQNEGKVCGYVDSEKTFDPEWAEKFGVDPDKLLMTQSSTISDATKDIIEMQKGGVDVIVADSITAMAPSTWFTEKGEMKAVEDSKQIGAHAREMSIAIPQWNQNIGNSLLILISQSRNQFGSMHATHIPSGGRAPGFFASVILKLWSSEAEGQAIKGKVKNGDLVFEQPIGNKVTWLVEKNKTGPKFLSGEYNFYYQGDFLGIDRVAETLDYATQYNLIKKSGTAWYEIEGQKMQKTDAIAFLSANPELLFDYEKRIINGG